MIKGLYKLYMVRLNSEDFSRSRNRGNIIFWLNYFDGTRRVFQMKKWTCRKRAIRCHDMLYMIRFLPAYCIFLAIWRRLGWLGKHSFTPKTDQIFFVFSLFCLTIQYGPYYGKHSGFLLVFWSRIDQFFEKFECLKL